MNYLIWLAENPWYALPILMAEFALFYTLYYRFNQNRVLKVILGAIFQPQNAILNVFCMSILCLDPPRELATTKRMKRYKKLKGDSGLNRWRISVANWICDYTNRFDPGHC